MPLGRRPVMRTVGRTAVIAGTATAVSGRVNRRQQAEEPSRRPRPSGRRAAASCGRRAGAADSDELISKLKELATLKDQGILTEEEFNSQKAKILAQMS